MMVAPISMGQAEHEYRVAYTAHRAACQTWRAASRRGGLVGYIGDDRTPVARMALAQAVAASDAHYATERRWRAALARVTTAARFAELVAAVA